MFENFTHEQAVDKLGDIATKLEKLAAEQKERIDDIMHLLLEFATDSNERLNKLCGVNTKVPYCELCGEEMEGGRYLDDIAACEDCYEKQEVKGDIVSEDKEEANEDFNEKVDDLRLNKEEYEVSL